MSSSSDFTSSVNSLLADLSECLFSTRRKRSGEGKGIPGSHYDKKIAEIERQELQAQSGGRWVGGFRVDFFIVRPLGRSATWRALRASVCPRARLLHLDHFCTNIRLWVRALFTRKSICSYDRGEARISDPLPPSSCVRSAASQRLQGLQSFCGVWGCRTEMLQSLDRAPWISRNAGTPDFPRLIASREPGQL